MTMDLSQARAELAAIADPKVLAANVKRGDGHGVNLSRLRAVAKKITTNQELSHQLWATGQVNERLLALLIGSPRKYTFDQLDAMVREANPPKVKEWFTNYVAKKSPLVDDLRRAWFADPDPAVSAVGWGLTGFQIAKSVDELNLDHLLDLIEADMVDAREDLQWSMNEVLVQIGVHHPRLRARALDIGHRLQVLADYPTSPGCTSPFAPAWIEEIVRRTQGRTG